MMTLYECKDFEVSRDSVSSMRICTIPESIRAATILAEYFHRITGGDFPISTDKPRDQDVLFELCSEYGESGFSFDCSGKMLTIRAGNEQAFVYAVYDLLEKYAGCRYYSGTVEYVPSEPSLVLHIEPTSFIPKLYYREVYYKGFEDKSFSEKHKMTSSAKHEGWGFWCHSFQKLLPNDKYFAVHPEYFALIDGKRHPDGQPCLSNPQVYKIMRRNLAKFMAGQPECKYWSVSQNDNDLYCRCPECTKRDEMDGGPMGSILGFVNRIAGEFPDKVISTLAYWYSRKPPLVTRPARNVHVMLCNIEALRGLPISTDPRNAGTKQELLDWAKICGNVSLWDYCIQFANLVSPFPNLRVLGSNIRFFVENNVTMLFSQANRDIGGEFCELRGYMLAKLMWDPYCDEMEVMRDFCKGYYGAAGMFILEYINKLHDAMEATGGQAGISEGPKNHCDTYLSWTLLQEYGRIFDEAERTVLQNKELLLRVQTARLPLYYAGIVLQYGSRDELLNMLQKFASIAGKSGLQKVEEWKITVDMFVTENIAALEG